MALFSTTLLLLLDPGPVFLSFLSALLLLPTMVSPNLLAGKAQAALTNITRFTQTTKRSTRNGLEHGQYFAASQ